MCSAVLSTIIVHYLHIQCSKGHYDANIIKSKPLHQEMFDSNFIIMIIQVANLILTNR